MKKIIFLISLLIYSKGHTQNSLNKKLSNAKVLEISQNYQKKALRFLDMPQYNQDSSKYYFEKATALLKVNSSLHHEELGFLYWHRNDISQVYDSFFSLDSLASAGWFHINKIPKNKQNKLLEYNFLVNWAFIKEELGENKTALQLFSKALLLAEDFIKPDLSAKVIKDKGIFYERFQLEEEQKLAYSYLSKSRFYYEKNTKLNNELELFSIYRSMIGYFDVHNKDSVFYYSNKIKSLLKSIERPQNHAWYLAVSGRDLVTYPLKGQKIITKEQYQEGKNKIIKALAILERYKIKKNKIRPYAYGILADLYLREKKYDSAIYNYKKSQEGYLLLKNQRGFIDMTSFIGKAYQQKGELANALFYLKEFYNQSIIYEKNKNERGLRENELQINILAQDKKLVQKQNLQTIFIVVLSLGALLLSWFYWNFKVKQKSNKQLALLNDDLENKNILLDKKNVENELLLREIHHRVKNNLEIVSSLLTLQSAQIEDSHTKDAMIEGQNRVNSIGIVHQKLYQGTNLGTVEMKDYFLNLSECILDSFGAHQRIDLQLAMDHLYLDIDSAVPLGLIVNELLTNCIKYAFPKGEKGSIVIKLHKRDNNILRLEVADNGVGKSGITHGTGFGGQLVSLLTQQLNGKMTEESQNGTTLIFDFKLKAA
ncbi:sensor histidine kinase [Flavobacterium sp.]|uniref:sensor histidine kinase n=1 Tax=Flavobacterium sp. TaxID=239 RepID=UPI0025DE2876|nr:sensor histidine kinase [Flavobacterium sp.]